MERLTKKLASGNVCFYGNGTPTQNAMMLPKIMKRLAEYEDAEEQGRLVRLPCKVGDTVYAVRKSDETTISKGTFVKVAYIVFAENGEAMVMDPKNVFTSKKRCRSKAACNRREGGR